MHGSCGSLVNCVMGHMGHGSRKMTHFHLCLQCSSLDFVINRLFMKLFKTNDMDIIKYCQSCFDFEMPSVLWAKRANKLNEKRLYCDNMFIKRLSK